MYKKVKKYLVVFFTALVFVLGIRTTASLLVQADESEQQITVVETWKELVNAVNADKPYIKLQNDLEDIASIEDSPTAHRLIFDGGKDCILDLNGHSLKVINHENIYYTSEFAMITLSNGSRLEIKDGSIVFDNWYVNHNRKAMGVVAVKDNSVLTATKVNMSNIYAGTVVYGDQTSSITLDGGKYIATNGFAVYLARKANLTLDGGAFIGTLVGDSTSSQSIDGYGALYSESTGELVINNAMFKSGIQVHNSQINAFAVDTHEVTINSKIMSEDIFDGTIVDAKKQNKEYYWYQNNQKSLYKTSDYSFSNTVMVISYVKKYPIEIMKGRATVNGNPVTEACYGQTVTIEADTPEAGMEFLRWDTSGVNLADHYSATTTFTMPASSVTLAAYYAKESVKSVALTVDVPIAGQKLSEINVGAENGVFIQLIEWYADHVKMEENEIFLPGKTYEIKVIIYPPDGNKFDKNLTATVNGKSAIVSANEQYAYVTYEVVTLADGPFSVVYNSATAKLGIGGLIELDTALMASQSATFKDAHDAGTVKYQWYRNGEPINEATGTAYTFTAEDVDSVFYVTVTVGNDTAWGFMVNVYNYLYQIYLNASEIVAGGRVPQMSSATPGIGINSDSLYVSEGDGQPAMDIDKAVLIPGRSYVLFGMLTKIGDADVPYGASVHVNGELMPQTIDAIGQFRYEFTVPAADYDVYYEANGEIGIGVTLTVDVEKMCNESSTFKHAYESANPTYQTVFYQWYKNGEVINGATKVSYTVKTTDKDSLINCGVTLVDGKYGVGEQFAISNVITVLNVNIPYPKDGESRVKSGISVDGATLSNIMWIHKDTEKTMQGDDEYVEGDVYEYLIVFKVNDTFNFDYQGNTEADMTVAYIYGERVENSGSGAGLMYYYGEVTAIHAHQYSDTVWDSDKEGHWQPCIIPNCPDPNEEWKTYVTHWGGNATCHTPGNCEQCGAEYYAEHDVSSPNYVYIDDMKCGSYCATEGCDYLAEWNYHIGGTSDCQHKAICEICHHEYGELEQHKFGDLMQEIPATENSEGVKAHKDCSVCKKHFDENGNEIADVTIEKLASSNGNQGLNGGAIVGIVMGSVAVVGIGGFAIFWFVIKKKSFADLLAILKK